MTAPIAFLIIGSGFWLAAILSVDFITGVTFGWLGFVMFCLAVAFAEDRA